MQVSAGKSISALVGCLALCLAQQAIAAPYWTTFGGTNIGTIDSTTGVGTVVGPTGHAGTYGVAEDPTSNILYATYGTTLATVNKSTGALTTVGNMGISIFGITFDASGALWTVSTGTGLYTVNKASGAVTLVGNGTPAGGWMDIAFSGGGVLYGVDGPRLYTINTGTGASTLVATFSGPCTDVMSIGFDTGGTLYGADYSAGKFCSINPGTAVTTLIGPTGVANPHGGDFGTPAPVPAPTLGEWAKIAFAGLLLAVGIGAIRRRQA
ncbi:IPTL-CTERM sorting domain-containing protein [Paucibacter sp. DJ2R-2]|uniref:IPTL-CTERM sorting domain-containing protein n=1 Tax=Paucibacter sp. DJ2R-2 TaxID=2893558 RepID=UPI0021E448DB|nr:IPTL-CTERM sorting domain-containing protein [Paucibacter sp. DJ2R-2]MCV2419224.1 IPTL-CTERM sorting domain-containing protein [Paucibacter sp. DJ4R-1]MCV2437821.1 IPTL-CTERM sorting domain-containing protein [Paucibacter sp. DJ2R-2]